MTVQKLFLRGAVEIGGKLREHFHLTKLGKVNTDTARHFFIALVRSGAAHARHAESPTFTAGRIPEKNKSLSRKICPSVIGSHW